MEKNGNEKGQRGSYVAPSEPNWKATCGVVYERKVCGSANNSLFLNSDDEDGDFDDEESWKLATQETKTEVECSALQQQHERITVHKMARHESLLRQSDTYGPLLGQSQEAYKAHLRFDERSREQAQLHRLLGDYMLTAKGDHIMDQMEEAVRDDYGGTNSSQDVKKDLSPLNSESSQDADADLADLLACMEGIAHYVAENEMPASS